MSPFQALFYNYLSSNTAYVGCVIGIIVGNDIEAARWIFSISAATTLYLSLAVLVIFCQALNILRKKKGRAFQFQILLKFQLITKVARNE